MWFEPPIILSERDSIPSGQNDWFFFGYLRAINDVIFSIRSHPTKTFAYIMFGDYLQNGDHESWNILRHPEMIERWTYYHDLFRSPLNVFAQYLVFWLPCSRWTCLITKQGRPGHFTSWIQVWHELEETVRILDKAGVAPDLMLDVLIVVSRFSWLRHCSFWHIWTYLHSCLDLLL